MVVFIQDNQDEIELIENNYKIESLNHLVNKTLRHNMIIDDTLHVITVISNICEFRRRWDLMKQFIERTRKFTKCKIICC